jgi:hypothetical protein
MTLTVIKVLHREANVRSFCIGGTQRVGMAFSETGRLRHDYVGVQLAHRHLREQVCRDGVDPAEKRSFAKISSAT